MHAFGNEAGISGKGLNMPFEFEIHLADDCPCGG